MLKYQCFVLTWDMALAQDISPMRNVVLRCNMTLKRNFCSAPHLTYEKCTTSLTQGRHQTDSVDLKENMEPILKWCNNKRQPTQKNWYLGPLIMTLSYLDEWEESKHWYCDRAHHKWLRNTVEHTHKIIHTHTHTHTHTHIYIYIYIYIFPALCAQQGQRGEERGKKTEKRKEKQERRRLR